MESYAVVKTGGKQYRVKAGDVLKVELIPGKEEGEKVELTTLASRTEGDLVVGTPELTEKVEATVLSSGLHKKVMVFKKRRRTTYRRKRGHRQPYSEIRIESLPGQ